MTYDSDPGGESDLRRRAAWLLVMLAVVAVLFVIVISSVVKTHDSSNGDTGPKPLDPDASSATSSPASSSQTHAHKSPSQHPPSQHPHTHSSTASTSPPTGRTSCPTPKPCVLPGDPGGAIQALNDYRAQHGQDAVPGTTSARAQQCALSNGSNCSGGWAETWDSRLNGSVMVHKVASRGHLLDPIKSFAVGWAFNPATKVYYFAVIRTD